MQIYNSLSRSKQTFKPHEPNKIRMYVCGMTVYDFCHLGHARMLVSFDVIQRWLRIKGYDVTYVRNITDIDDKIIRKAVEQNTTIAEVTSFYTAAMHADEKALGVQSPDHEPRATAHVNGMLEIIQALQSKGLAYQANNGDVNFSVRKFPEYGKLSGRSIDDLRAGERIAIDNNKQDPLDFVLWKAAKADEPEEIKWQSPYGFGRPGWHIECSAMSRNLLGLPLDIHGGGPDLKFPHHENEIAQSEGAYGKQLANYWMHCGSLMVDDEKMSKSLGNFKTIRQTIGIDQTDTQSANYEFNLREAEMLRFFIVRNHYRSQQNFAPDNLNDAQLALDRMYHTLKNIGFDPIDAIDWNNSYAKAFAQAMDDDFNTALAISVLFEMSTAANRQKDKACASLMKALGGVLGLLQQDPEVYLRSVSRYTSSAQNITEDQLTEEQIDILIKERQIAKQEKQFQQADAIRDQLKAAGIELEDKPGNLTEWRRV